MAERQSMVIVGDSLFAEVALEYFTHDSPFRVVGFAVEREFLSRQELLGLPVVAVEDLPNRFAPANHHFYAAIVYTRLNRLRERLYRQVKSMGYTPASFISSRAVVAANAKVGEHVFIFEHNTVQPFVTLGDNVVLWSGNHIGHHSTVEDNCFISSHVVISGSCRVGRNTFMGVNCCLGNDLTIGKDCWIGNGVTLSRNVPDGTLYGPPESEPSKVSSYRFFKVHQ